MPSKQEAVSPPVNFVLETDSGSIKEDKSRKARKPPRSPSNVEAVVPEEPKIGRLDRSMNLMGTLLMFLTYISNPWLPALLNSGRSVKDSVVTAIKSHICGVSKNPDFCMKVWFDMRFRDVKDGTTPYIVWLYREILLKVWNKFAEVFKSIPTVSLPELPVLILPTRPDDVPMVQELYNSEVLKKINEIKEKEKQDGEKKKKAKKDKEIGRVGEMVEDALAKGPKGLKEEFIKIKKNKPTAAEMKGHLDIIAKNRYKDVICLENTRVKLGEKREYVNSNYVATPQMKRRFICTQAPMKATIEDFWAMVWQEHSEKIVMLCNLKEKNLEKCAQYFPITKGSTKYYGEYTIKMKREEAMENEKGSNSKVKISTLELRRTGFGDRRIIHHYHWNSWPHAGVPEADKTMMHLLNAVESTDHPIVVHCSAGVGRAGVLMFVQFMKETIYTGETYKKGNDIHIRLRKQRDGVVQSVDQYLYTYVIFFLIIEYKGLIRTEWKDKMQKFIEECKKMTKN